MSDFEKGSSSDETDKTVVANKANELILGLKGAGRDAIEATIALQSSELREWLAIAAIIDTEEHEDGTYDVAGFSLSSLGDQVFEVPGAQNQAG
jgi:hypothetical protein